MPQGFSGKGYRDVSMDCDIERRASSIMLAGPDVIAPSFSGARTALMSRLILRVDAGEPAPLPAKGTGLDRLPCPRIRGGRRPDRPGLVDTGGWVRGGSRSLSRRAARFGGPVVLELGIHGEFLYRYDMGDAPAQAPSAYVFDS